MNTSDAPAQYHLRADGLPGLAVASEADIAVPATSSQIVILRLRAPGANAPQGASRVTLQVASVGDPATRVQEKTVFFGLRP